MPTYFPGAPPGADPFFDFEAAFAREIAKLVPGYPLGYFVEVVDPAPAGLTINPCAPATLEPATWWAE